MAHSTKNTNHSCVSSLVDDDYDHDVISNLGQGSLESSFDDFTFSAVHRFETTRWTASDIQAYIHTGLNLTSPQAKLVRIYVDGLPRRIRESHPLQLRQAKPGFLSYTSSWVSFQMKCYFKMDTIRLELVRHCRRVSEATKGAPCQWELAMQFLQAKGIGYVAVDEGSSVDPNYDTARVRGYDELKGHVIVIKTRRTHTFNAQRRLASLTPSRRETSTTLACVI
ncbi:hypothetical protein BYT27DRAFT_7230014 [Phlegmacium glaucopus]|nr:hypothetical protein BYT27DRAFT_7230014 [Phlegmacium glaucopus]